MKILVISDTHRELSNVYALIKQINDIHRIIHLGDHDSDAEELGNTIPIPIDYVAGNCDYFTQTPKDKLITIHGCKLWLTHGHMYRVKSEFDTIAEAGKKKKADIVLFGHTHRQVVKHYPSLTLLNPGSISLPRDGKAPGYAVLEIDENGKPHVTLKKIKKM